METHSAGWGSRQHVWVSSLCAGRSHRAAPCLHPTCQPHDLLGCLAGPSEAEGGVHTRAFQRVYLNALMGRVSQTQGVLANIPNHTGGPADGVTGLSGSRPSLGSCPSQWGQDASAQKPRGLTPSAPQAGSTSCPHTPSLPWLWLFHPGKRLSTQAQASLLPSFVHCHT